MSLLALIISHAATGPAWLAPGHVDPNRPFWTAWPQEPLLLLGLSVSVGLYWLGWSRLSRVGSGSAVSTWRATAFIIGSLAVGAALLSPIAAFSERLFFMHMIQHLLLLLIAPPLLLLGQPLVPMLWGLPSQVRRPLGRALRPRHALARVGNLLTTPAFAAAAFVVTLAIWHIPVFYDAAQGRTFTHDLEHLMFFGTALLYWWPIIHPSGGRRRLSFGLALPYLLPPFLESILIGAMLTFASQPFYQTYAEMEMPWGFNPVTDQQLGGLIMWIPGGMFFLIPVIGLLIALLNNEVRPARPVSMPRQEHASRGPG